MVTTITGTVDYTETVTIPYTAMVTATATTTMVEKRKRDANPAPEPTGLAVLRRGTNVADQVSVVLQGAAQGSYDPNVLTQWGPQISSACNCLNLGPLTTVTVTSQAEATVSLRRSRGIIC
jgi:hypothetical protein